MTKDRAYRGGGWSNDAAGCRASYRFNLGPGFRVSRFGFRCNLVVRPGSYRVFRGGGWFFGAAFCRAASRGGHGPGNRSGDIGFRCWRKE